MPNRSSRGALASWIRSSGGPLSTNPAFRPCHRSIHGKRTVEGYDSSAVRPSPKKCVSKRTTRIEQFIAETSYGNVDKKFSKMDIQERERERCQHYIITLCSLFFDFFGTIRNNNLKKIRKKFEKKIRHKKYQNFIYTVL